MTSLLLCLRFKEIQGKQWYNDVAFFAILTSLQEVSGSAFSASESRLHFHRNGGSM